MNTKDILLVGAGLVVGYLLTIYLLKKTIDKGAMDSTEPMVNQAKIDKCNAEVDLKLQTVKIANPEALEAFKKQVFEDCMARS